MFSVRHAARDIIDFGACKKQRHRPACASAFVISSLESITAYCHANQEWQWRNTLFTIAK